MTVLGGESPVDGVALAPRIEPPWHESVVEALHWMAPPSVPDLKRIYSFASL
jgi:hypothetical protein